MQHIIRVILLCIGLNTAVAWAYQMTPTLELHKSYMDLSESLGKSDNTHAIESFLQRYDGTIYADKLRSKYLHLLAQQNDRQHFLATFKPSDDQSLQCYYDAAMIERGQTKAAYAHAKDIWQNTPRVSTYCLNLLKLWVDKHPQSEESLFKRFYLALQDEQWLQLKALKEYLNSEQRQIADYWMHVYKKPTSLSTKKLPSKPYARLIVLTSLQRQVRRDIEEAESGWKYWKTRYRYKNNEVNNFIGKIVLFHALRGSHETEKWVSELRPGELDPLVFEWRVRAALLQKNWPLVQHAILAMPKELQELPCWSYWLARAYEAQGKKTQANALFVAVSKQQDYYGFMAQQYLGRRIHVASLRKPPALNQVAFPFTNEMEYIHDLMTQQKFSEAYLLSTYLESKSTNEQRWLIANFYHTWHWYSQAIRVITQSEYDNVLELEYPMGYSSIVNEYAKKRSLPPALVYAIMRQESRFQSYVKSPAGAIGLMQLMPRTAQITAKRQKLKIHPTDLLKPQINVALGTAYLQVLLSEFRHPVLAAAAYNAGERVVSHWRVRHKPKDIVMWIETLPWGETRGYLKKVIHNYLIYQYRLGEQPEVIAFLKPVHPRFTRFSRAFG